MSENGLHKIQVMKQALVAIQKLHKPATPSKYLKVPVCEHCVEVFGHEWDYANFPCETRRLADKGLEGDRESEV